MLVANAFPLMGTSFNDTGITKFFFFFLHRLGRSIKNIDASQVRRDDFSQRELLIRLKIPELSKFEKKQSSPLTLNTCFLFQRVSCYFPYRKIFKKIHETSVFIVIDDIIISIKIY